MKPICCICTGRHHPLSCPTALAALDQCAEPTPDDYDPHCGEGLALVYDINLSRFRERSTGEIRRHRHHGRAS